MVSEFLYKYKTFKKVQIQLQDTNINHLINLE